MSNVYPERDTQTILRLHFELGDTKVDIEGDPDLVVRQLLTQLSKIYPALDLARKLTFDPDLAKLSEMLVGLVEFDPKELLLIVREAPADESMLITLLGMYIGFRLGKVAGDSLSAAGLAKATGKALKTVANQVAWMVDEGLIERVGRGEYRITSRGIKRAEEIAVNLKKGG